MYNINILTECNDENIRVAIISAVREYIEKESNINVRRIKRIAGNVPVWGRMAREENLR